MAITKSVADAFLTARAQRLATGAQRKAKAVGGSAGSEVAKTADEATQTWKPGAPKSIPAGLAVESHAVSPRPTFEGSLLALKEAADLHGAAHLNFNGDVITALRGQGLDTIKMPVRQRFADEVVAHFRASAQGEAARAERVAAFARQGGTVADPHVVGLRPEGLVELEGLVHVRPFAINRLTAAQYDALPPGSRLYLRDGAEHIKGVDAPCVAEGRFVSAGVPATSRGLHGPTVPPALVTPSARLAWLTIESSPSTRLSHTTYVAQALADVRSPSEIAVLARQLTSDVRLGFRHPDAIREAAGSVRDPAARVQWEAIASQLSVPKARPTRASTGGLELDFNEAVPGLTTKPGHVQEALDIAYQTVKDRKQPILFRWNEYAFQIRPDHRRDELTAMFRRVTVL